MQIVLRGFVHIWSVLVIKVLFKSNLSINFRKGHTSITRGPRNRKTEEKKHIQNRKATKKIAQTENLIQNRQKPIQWRQVAGA